MTEYINHGSLKVAKELDDLINKKVCVGLDLEPENFWVSFIFGLVLHFADSVVSVKYIMHDFGLLG